MRLPLLVAFIGCLVFGANAKEMVAVASEAKPRLFVPSISIGTVGGAQITTNSVYLKYGGGVYASVHNILNDRLSLGVGVGVEQIDNESLYPFYLEGKGMLSDKAATGFLMVTAGYAAGNNPSYENYDGYNYRGGGLFGAGWGYRWPLKKDDYFSISVSYRQQFIHLSYSDHHNFNFRERLSYSLLFVRASIEF